MRSLPKTPFALVGALALALGVLAMATPAGAAAVCAFDVPTGVVTVTLAASETAVISRLGDGTITLDAAPCDVATVMNTDTIQVSGTGPSDELTIDLSGGPFGPGLTPEADGGTSEIEFIVDLGSATPIGKVHILGSAGADSITIGAGGVNLNADEAVGDADVTFTNPVTLDADGGAGADSLSAAGGAGSGAAMAGVLIHGGDGDDLLFGAAGGDVIHGDSGTDTVDYSNASQVSLDLGLGSATLTGGTDQLSGIEDADGSPGDDHIVGDVGSNALRGGGGDDLIDGAGGDDTIDGAAGIDTLDLSNWTQGVSVSLKDGTASALEVGTETLAGIENVNGSPLDDRIVGGGGPNDILGGGGNDLLDGWDGDDTIDGGVGNDTVRFGSPTKGITVDLKAGTATGAGTDALTSIENVMGTNRADDIQGSGGSNTLNGRGGPDIIHGGAGRDVISGRKGNDYLVGGDGGDTITGGLGKDQLEGGSGFDTCSGGPDPDSWTGCEG